MMTDHKLKQDLEIRNKSTRSSTLLYLLVGGGIGAVAALLFAPKAGSEFRSDISEITKQNYDKTLEAAGHLKQKTNEFYQAAKNKSDRAYEFAAAKLHRAPDQLGNPEGRPDHINGEILEIAAGTDENAVAPRRETNFDQG